MILGYIKEEDLNKIVDDTILNLIKQINKKEVLKDKNTITKKDIDNLDNILNNILENQVLISQIIDKIEISKNKIKIKLKISNI